MTDGSGPALVDAPDIGPALARAAQDRDDHANAFLDKLSQAFNTSLAGDIKAELVRLFSRR